MTWLILRFETDEISYSQMVNVYPDLASGGSRGGGGVIEIAIGVWVAYRLLTGKSQGMRGASHQPQSFL